MAWIIDEIKDVKKNIYNNNKTWNSMLMLHKYLVGTPKYKRNLNYRNKLIFYLIQYL